MIRGDWMSNNKRPLKRQEQWDEETRQQRLKYLRDTEEREAEDASYLAEIKGKQVRAIYTGLITLVVAGGLFVFINKMTQGSNPELNEQNTVLTTKITNSRELESDDNTDIDSIKDDNTEITSLNEESKTVESLGRFEESKGSESSGTKNIKLSDIVTKDEQVQMLWLLEGISGNDTVTSQDSIGVDKSQQISNQEIKNLLVDLDEYHMIAVKGVVRDVQNIANTEKRFIVETIDFDGQISIYYIDTYYTLPGNPYNKLRDYINVGDELLAYGTPKGFMSNINLENPELMTNEDALKVKESIEQQSIEDGRIVINPLLFISDTFIKELDITSNKD